MTTLNMKEMNQVSAGRFADEDALDFLNLLCAIDAHADEPLHPQVRAKFDEMFDDEQTWRYADVLYQLQLIDPNFTVKKVV